MTIKAIETRYAGCRFRSRLEARWAVFFDAHSNGGGWVNETRHGFGAYRKNLRPWFLDNASNPDIPFPWTEPRLDPYETSCEFAYAAARSARFEHGESG